MDQVEQDIVQHGVMLTDHQARIEKLEGEFKAWRESQEQLGGLVGAEGPPEKIAKNPDSYTGQHLIELL